MMISALLLGDLGIGVIIKFILNLILIPISPNKFILGGTAGAAFATVICHVVATSIEFYILRKNIKLKLNPSKFIIKPILATSLMSIISYLIYNILLSTTGEKIAIIFAILIAIVIYIIALLALKIFSKEEIFMIPYGKKIYYFLKKLRLYGKRRKPLK